MTALARHAYEEKQPPCRAEDADLQPSQPAAPGALIHPAAVPKARPMTPKGFNKIPQPVTPATMESAYVDHVQRNILEDGETATIHQFDPEEEEMDLPMWLFSIGCRMLILEHKHYLKMYSG